MTSMDYIVRIYRHEKERPRGIVGIVEEVGAEGKRAFTSLDELWQILNPSKGSDASSALRRKKHPRPSLQSPSSLGEKGRGEGESQSPPPLGGEGWGEG